MYVIWYPSKHVSRWPVQLAFIYYNAHHHQFSNVVTACIFCVRVSTTTAEINNFFCLFLLSYIFVYAFCVVYQHFSKIFESSVCECVWVWLCFALVVMTMHQTVEKFCFFVDYIIICWVNTFRVERVKTKEEKIVMRFIFQAS